MSNDIPINFHYFLIGNPCLSSSLLVGSTASIPFWKSSVPSSAAGSQDLKQAQISSSVFSSSILPAFSLFSCRLMSARRRSCLPPLHPGGLACSLGARGASHPKGWWFQAPAAKFGFSWRQLQQVRLAGC